jgi:hypothetical protein
MIIEYCKQSVLPGQQLFENNYQSTGVEGRRGSIHASRVARGF